MNSRPYLSVINYRTFIALTISGIVTFLFYKYQIRFELDLTLLSIAIVFPLVFTIRGSFRRREKALEHLSEFRSTLKSIYYLFMSQDKLTEEDKQLIQEILEQISSATLSHLNKKNSDMRSLDEVVNKVYEFTINKDRPLSKGLTDKIFKLMKYLHESIENLHAIHIHRTPISLKAYCEIFIYIFPIILVPTVIYNIESVEMHWASYLVIMLTEFILISLYNIQNQLEYPFDNIGIDDINLDNFKINR
jgi:predicted membrane chloride channel (bestrophin family)